MAAWNVEGIASQRGKLAIVTDATSVIGAGIALGLARAGASVILAARDAAKGAAALSWIRALHPMADITFRRLDLASLASVQDFAESVSWEQRRIDLLVNNANAMALPERQVTEDGFEMHLATNYLGQFALTSRLLPRLLAAPAPRVVTVARPLHRSARIHFEDLQVAQDYRPAKAQAQSRLAALIFGLELERRARRSGWQLVSTAVQLTGALPILLAATSLEATGGVTGAAHIPEQARHPAVAERLWALSEELTGVAAQPWPMAA